MVVHDKLKWVHADANQGDSHYDLFVYIGRVRNNLFHGGKFQGRYLSDPERSLELINHCTTILNASLEINSDLNEAFSQ